MNALPSGIYGQVALTVLLLAALPAGASASDVLATGVAKTVEADAVSLTIESPLQILQLGGIPEGVASIPFRLAAEFVHVETDTLRGPGYGIYYDPADVETTESDAVNAVIEGGARRVPHRLTVFPNDAGAQVSLIGNAGALQPADGTGVQVGFLFKESREPAVLPTDGLQWVGAGSIIVRGSFVLTLWEWDAIMQSADGTRQEFRTGVKDSSVLGLPPETTPVARESQETQTYFYVSNGVLTLPTSVGTLDFFMDSARIGVQGNLRMRDVVGQVQNNEGLASFSELTAQGEVSAIFPGKAQSVMPFELTAVGPASLHGDGMQLAVIASAPESTWPLPLLLGLVGLVVPTVAIAGRKTYLAMESRRLDRAEASFDAQDYVAAIARAEPLRRSPRFSLEAELVYIEALVREGHADEALTALSEDGGPWTHAPAMREYLLALAHAALGQREAALAALGRSVELAPVMASQARREPLLEGLADEFPDGYV